MFKFAFSKVEHAIGQLRAVLPPALVAQIDWNSLVLESGDLVDSTLEQARSDVLWSVKLGGRPAFLYVLLEHQSTVDPLMAYRLLKYMLAIWDRWLAEHPDAKTLPVIIPVVVHHSDSGWTAATALEQLFDITESARIAIGEHALRMRFILDDVSRVEDHVLRARPMTPFGRVVLWSLRDARDGDALLRGLAAWADLLREINRTPGGRDALFAFASYVCEVLDLTVTELEEIVVTAVGDEVKNTMASTADQLREQGRREGEARDLREGEARGSRKTLRLQLDRRFGPLSSELEARLANATDRELEQWTLRILDARTLAEVLGDA